MSMAIGITENRLHHLLGVARRAYNIAKEMGKDEDFCRRCFMLGWLHDVGYEFAETQAEHSDVSADLLNLVTDEVAATAIRDHGRLPQQETDEYTILNIADMTVSSEGNEVPCAERMHGIKEKYGADSWQYLGSCDVCRQVGLDYE